MGCLRIGQATKNIATVDTYRPFRSRLNTVTKHKRAHHKCTLHSKKQEYKIIRETIQEEKGGGKSTIEKEAKWKYSRGVPRMTYILSVRVRVRVRAIYGYPAGQNRGGFAFCLKTAGLGGGGYPRIRQVRVPGYPYVCLVPRSASLTMLAETFQIDRKRCPHPPTLSKSTRD